MWRATTGAGSCPKNLLTDSLTSCFPVQRGERQMIIFYNLLGSILRSQEAPWEPLFIQHTLIETCQEAETALSGEKWVNATWSIPPGDHVWAPHIWQLWSERSVCCLSQCPALIVTQHHPRFLLQFPIFSKDVLLVWSLAARVTSLLMLYFCLFIYFYWSIVDLQCCVSFRCTAKWFSFIYIYILFSRFFSIIGYNKILNIVPCAM